ncbi:olfactory receptor 10AG1-like [Monodelphis domestica]|uniref:olfactory receptor 10AG1-like n=1 Tax=Monodelphis domestica TaxID=13616 RepID=UPI0024E220D5|nr:olfactory receptor 10AG1-like [Monodelphis domestica]
MVKMLMKITLDTLGDPLRDTVLRAPRENNLTFLAEFVLLGFSDLPNLHGFLFGVFLVIYLCILMGNGLLIVITKVDPSLQTPMYFFLGNFSFLEICYTSVTIPKMLADLWSQKTTISFVACAVQTCFLYILGGAECLLLAVMAYDRYVAICKPLYYPLIMNNKICIELVVASWMIGVPILIEETYLIFSLNFCGPNKINHIFCEAPPLLKLACGDTYKIEVSVHVIALLFVLIPFLLIFTSYLKIITTILKLPSTSGRTKAFSTCSSHLMVVTLFYGSGSIVYLQPRSFQSAESGKVLSLFYTTVTPMLNPVIYSLRNKDVLAALRKLLPKSIGSLNN